MSDNQQIAKQEPKKLTPVDALKESIRKLGFKDALPAHITEEKFRRVLLTAVTQTPALVECDRGSLFTACMKAAQDGLLPDGREAALVTFRVKGQLVAQYMPMVGGILKKVRNSGELASITAQIVYEKDKFRYWVDADGEHIEHEPLMFGERGDPLGAYALAKTKDGAVYIEVMTRQQIMAIKEVSRAKDSGPWAGAFEDEMWKKSAIRRLSKRLPMSTDVDEVIRADDEMYDVAPPAKDVVTTTSEPAAPAKQKSKPARLGKIIEAKSTPVEPEAEEPPHGDDIPL